MIWRLYHENELISEFGTNHSISLDDAIELCGLEPVENEEYDYIYEDKEIWYDCLRLEIKKSVITEVRTLAGLSRAEMSRKYNIPVRTLENWESGATDAPDYTIDLLTRVVLEDSKRYEEIIYTVTHVRSDAEFESLKTQSITKAVKEAKSDWSCMTDYDKERNEIEIRIYELSEESREKSDNWNCDLIEWR